LKSGIPPSSEIWDYENESRYQMLRKVAIALCVLSLAYSASCFGQFGGLIKKKEKPPEVSDKAPEYSDSDKAKMAEIAQRPAVQDEIQRRWDELRTSDLQTAYAVNQTAMWGITEDPIEHRAVRTDPRLYSNPMMQVYLNNIGQKLVPKDSPNFFTFRILADPLPKAISLSTGSVYISTGLLAMLDSEAQLSYVLAHEIAHVEQKHAYNRIRNAVLEDELNKEKEAKAERTKALIGIAGALGGAAIGGGFGGGQGAFNGALIGGLGSYVASSFFVHSGVQQTAWSTVEENEADELGTKYMLNEGYDAREVPRLYASIDKMVGKDSRVGLGFIGEPRRVKERIGHVKELLDGPLHEQLEKLQKSGSLIGSGSTFPVLLSAAKRDNGILAVQYDLFAMARQNLEDALEQRSNDPAVHFYLSKVMTLTAKTPEERRAAVTHISDAIRLDATRGSIPDLHLEYAVSLLNQDNSSNKDQVIGELKTYVALYQRDNAGRLPGNMSAIFDYFNLEGESAWYLPPDWYPATQLSNMGLPSTLAPEEVVRKATFMTADPVGAPGQVQAPQAIKTSVKK
jgi:Peptidase family M48